MDIKTRRRKRVAIIVVVMLVIAGAIGGLILLQQWKRQRQDEHLRLTGLEAYEEGDHALAVENLRRYLSHVNNDVEALYAFSKASLKNPEPRNRHIAQAIGALSQVVKLDPDHPDAMHDLLMLRTLVGQNDEALELADRILQNDPKDTKALSSKAIVLMRQEKLEEALAVAEQALALDPGLYQVNLIRLQLRHELGEPVEELLEGAKALQQANADDPRYEMLLGYAYALANDEQQAAQWLRSAAQRELPDAEFANTLLNVLDTANMYRDSLNVLMRAGTHADWENLQAEMASRLFEDQQYQEVVDRLADLDPATAPVDVLAIKAMALYSLDQRDEAEQLRTALSKRDDSAQAPAWVSVLQEVYAPEPQAKRIIDACNKALEIAPGNAYFHAFLGNAYSVLGDHELAMASWREAANRRPAWAGVRSQIARAALSKRDAEQAIRFAREAYIRQPDRVGNVVTWIRARAMNIEDYHSPEAEELLTLIDRVQQAAPGEPQTRVLRVSLLAEMGRTDQATAALLSFLDDKTELDQAYWFLLAEISRKHGLGVEDRLLARVQEQEGSTAELALTRATQLAREGQADQGLALIEAGYKAAPANDRPRWQLVHAMFLDVLNDSAAHDAWAKLVDDQPDSARALQLALRAKAVHADRALTGRVLELLRDLMGEDSVAWRNERARFLLDSPEVERDSTAAIAILRKIIEDTPKRIEPRLMLAQGLDQLGRETQAIAELRAADQAIPNSPALHLELARLHQQVRQFSGARNYLDIVINNPDATADDLRQAASLLARQGDDVRAIELLERLQRDPETADDNQRLLLATLYHRNGQNDRAAALLEQSLQNPDASTLAFALEFYQASKQPQNVQRILTLLDGDVVSESERQQILGGFYARSGESEAAASLYRDRVTASPRDARAWTQLVAVHLAAGRIDEALTAADEGLAQLPDDPSLRRVKQEAQTIRRTTGIDWARPLLITLVAEPKDGDAAAQALRLIAQASESNDPDAADRLAQQLRGLADQHQNLLSLQTAAARVYLKAGQPREAADVASRASRTFPRAAEPAWLHAQAMADSKQWLDALGAATEWRSRTPGATTGADMMIAEAHLQLGDPARALQTIEPHLQPALAAPAEHAAVVSRYVRALVDQKRYDDAAGVLMALVPQDPAWRRLAMQLAAEKIQAGPVAANWLAQVGTAVPAEATAEHIALAQSYWTLSQRLNDSQMAAQARQTIDRVTQRSDAPVIAWYLRGVIAEQLKDLADAESSYRAAIERDANFAVAKNNLAMVLINRDATGSDLKEAAQLAQAAVEASPGNVFFLDTLAAVQVRTGNVDAAVDALRRAIELDPNNDTWKRNLAKILQDSGRDDEAQRLLDQIDRRAGV